jgi:hypothetical protein
VRVRLNNNRPTFCWRKALPLQLESRHVRPLTEISHVLIQTNYRSIPLRVVVGVPVGADLQIKLSDELLDQRVEPVNGLLRLQHLDEPLILDRIRFGLQSSHRHTVYSPSTQFEQDYVEKKGNYLRSFLPFYPSNCGTRPSVIQ